MSRNLLAAVRDWRVAAALATTSAVLALGLAGIGMYQLRTAIATPEAAPLPELHIPGPDYVRACEGVPGCKADARGLALTAKSWPEFRAQVLQLPTRWSWQVVQLQARAGDISATLSAE